MSRLAIGERVATKPKLLVFELWGIGDLILATTLIDKARADYEVYLLAKPFAQELLGPTYPELVFLPFNAPWTVHYGKYRLWRWRWGHFLSLLLKLRREKFHAAISVRHDPRDHFLMWLIGARKRCGVPTKGSGIFLTDDLREPPQKWHRVEGYRELGAKLGVEKMEAAVPKLARVNYRTDRIEKSLGTVVDPILCLHLGAGQPVRRWPESYFATIISRLRERFHFHLVVVRDGDEFAGNVLPLADTAMEKLSVRELVDVVSRTALLLCNDSGPMHVAVACDRPTIAMFGPGDPRWFRPWGDKHHMVIRDICPYRPCFDYCKFPEPYCLTRVLPDEVWPEIESHVRRLLAEGSLPPAFAGTS